MRCATLLRDVIARWRGGRLATALLCLVAAIASGQAFADTQVSGAIDVPTRWTVAGSPYVVTQDLTVGNGARLTVDAGVTIYMGAGTGLRVESGSLSLNGTPASPIQVLSNLARTGTAAPGDWNRWVLSPGTEASTLEHVRFEHGKGLLIQGSAPVLNHLDLRNHLGPAIEIDLQAAPNGIGLTASGNLLNGIAVPPGDITRSLRWGLRGIPYVLVSGTLSVGASPAVTAVNPLEVEQGVSTTLTLAGSRLAGASNASVTAAGVVVQVNGTSTATNAQLSVSLDLGAALGPVDLSFLTDAGEVRVPNAFTVVSGLPAITGLDPAVVVVNQGAFDLQVTGRKFRQGTQLLVDGVATTTSVLSATQLRATVPNRTQAINASIVARVPDPSNPGQFLASNTVTLPVLASGALGLAPINTRVAVGRERMLTVSLPYDAPPGGFVVGLASTAPQVAAVPGTVIIDAGQRSAQVTVLAQQVGSAVITASRPGFVSAQTQVTVTSDASYSIAPLPLVVVPGGNGRQFTIEASDPPRAGENFFVSSPDTDILRVDTPFLLLTQGQSSVSGTLTGLRDGIATLVVQRMGGDGAVIQVPVFVGTGLGGGSVAFAAPLGLIRNAPLVLPPNVTVGPTVAQPLGLIRSAPLEPGAGSTVGPIQARPLGLVRGDALPVPAGSSIAPIVSRPLGLIRNGLPGMPAGAVITPVVSPVLGLTRP